MPPKLPAPQVLVVDDDEGLGVLILDALREQGLSAEAVVSGRQAIKQIAENQPELLLLDLRLADASGATILAQLKGEGLHVPFIVVTGQGDERIAVEMMKQGALDYVMKDTGMLSRLPRVVRRALEKLADQRALASAQAALLESEQRILVVSENERQRIGADLHDNLGQQLTAIELLCHSLREDLAAQPELENRMAKICRYLQESVAQTRQLARGLMPVSLTTEGLVDSLSAMTERMSNGRVRCQLCFDGPVRLLDHQVATHLFRIAQESVNNAIKHGQPTQVTVSLTEEKGAIKLRIEDDGAGLPPPEKIGTGLGLEIIKHRANVIGATIETISSPGKGVKIICTLKGQN
jgi:signal transduction histidine kinase